MDRENGGQTMQSGEFVYGYSIAVRYQTSTVRIGGIIKIDSI